MKDKLENIDEIIAKYLAGEATKEEVTLLEEWRNLSNENNSEFDLFKKLLSQADTLKEVMQVDTDKAWNQVKNKIYPIDLKVKHLPASSFLPFAPFIRIAAIILLVAGLGTAAYFLLKPGKKEIIIASNQSVQKSTLPDGSTLTLNKNSLITYDQNSFSKKRTIHLSGEAFFDVKHDEHSPFVIETRGLMIEDIGTSFNVKSNQESNVIIITVVSGTVKLFTLNNSGMLLLAGEEAIYNLKTKTFEKSTTINKNISSYKDKIFIFDNTDLEMVIKLLNEIYQSDIEFENENLKSCKLTATFNNENIDDVVNIISETLGLTIEKTDHSIILQGEGCK